VVYCQNQRCHCRVQESLLQGTGWKSLEPRHSLVLHQQWHQTTWRHTRKQEQQKMNKHNSTVLLTSASNYFDCPQECCSMLQIHHLTTQFTLNRIHQRQFWYHTLSTTDKQMQYLCIKITGRHSACKNLKIRPTHWNDATRLWHGWEHHLNQNYAQKQSYNVLTECNNRKVKQCITSTTCVIMAKAAAMPTCPAPTTVTLALPRRSSSCTLVNSSSARAQGGPETEDISTGQFLKQ